MKNRASVANRWFYSSILLTTQPHLRVNWPHMQVAASMPLPLGSRNGETELSIALSGCIHHFLGQQSELKACPDLLRPHKGAMCRITMLFH